MQKQACELSWLLIKWDRCSHDQLAKMVIFEVPYSRAYRLLYEILVHFEKNKNDFFHLEAHAHNVRKMLQSFPFLCEVF